jgi:cytoskeleton protein RodZ
MSLTLGEKLRQAREERGLTISEVAEQTRISALYLESIENDDYRTLPGGIFNKGFVKSYAKHVGLNEQEALQDYAALLSEQGSDVGDDPKTYRPEVLTDDRSRSALLPTLIFAFIIVGIMVWAILAFLRNYSDNQNQPLANTNTNNSVNTNSQPTPTPTPAISTNEIKVEFKALSEPISLTYWNDGKMASKNVTPNEPLSVNAQQSAKFRYYRGFTPDKIQLTVNGKQIAAPNPPPKGVGIEFEINKQNIGQVLQSGAIPSAAPNANVSNTAPRP